MCENEAIGCGRVRAAMVSGLLWTAVASSAFGAAPVFQVSSTQEGQYCSVAGGTADRFMVVWRGPDGDSEGIRGRWVNNGVPQGTDIIVNADTANLQNEPEVTWVSSANSWAVAWVGAGGILGKVYGDDGSVSRPDYVVNDTAVGSKFYPRLADAGALGEIITWTDFGTDPFSIAAQWSDPPFSDFVAYLDPGGEHSVVSDVAGWSTGLGRAVLVWETAALAERHLLGRRFTSPGSGGAVFQITTALNPDVGGQNPSVAADSAGNFFVVWSQVEDVAPYDSNIMGRRYDSAGNPLTVPFQINTLMGDRHQSPRIAVDTSGNVMVAWQHVRRIRARRFNGSGGALGPDFLVASPGFNEHYKEPDVAADAAGNFMIAWHTSHGGSGDPNGIFAKRYLPCSIAADTDADSHCGTDDNCPTTYNPDQRDSDGADGGDVCDACPFGTTCDPTFSGAATIGASGGGLTEGNLSISVQAGSVDEDTSFSITGGLAGSEYGLGVGSPIFDVVKVGPEGIGFNPPVSLNFGWPDADSNGFIDNTSPRISENNLVVYQNGVAVTRRCIHSACDFSTCGMVAGCGIGPLEGLTGICCIPALDLWILPAYSFSEFVVAEELCPAEPLPLAETTSYHLYNKGTLTLKDNADDAKDVLSWKGNTSAMFGVDLGDPTIDDGTDYALCFYDRSGATPVLIGRATVQAGGTCGAKPCWKTSGTAGFGYALSNGGPEGVTKMKLGVEEGYSGKVQVKGKGVSLTDVARYLPLPAPPLPLPLVVDLIGSNGLVVRSEYTSATVKKNEPGIFKAKSDLPTP